MIGSWLSVGTGCYILRGAKPTVFVSGSRGRWRWRLTPGPTNLEIAGFADTLIEAKTTAVNAYMTMVEKPRRIASQVEKEFEEVAKRRPMDSFWGTEP